MNKSVDSNHYFSKRLIQPVGWMHVVSAIYVISLMNCIGNNRNNDDNSIDDNDNYHLVMSVNERQIHNSSETAPRPMRFRMESDR